MAVSLERKGGELISKGEDELYNLGIRIRERFGDLFSEEYHPDVFTIKATQVPRASASAVAFGMGLFAERGNLGPGKHRAFSVTSESHASDLLLRFFDTCETYKACMCADVLFSSSMRHLIPKLDTSMCSKNKQSLKNGQFSTHKSWKFLSL